MKAIHFLLMASGLLGACSAPSNQAGATATQPSAPASTPAAASGTAVAPAKHATATGTIESIDPAARTVTIAHGPVPALDWPAMTMTFQAPDVDLAGFKPGDRVAFDLSAAGMAATVTSLRHE